MLFHVNLNDLKINLQNKNKAPKISKVKHAEPPTNKVATPPQTKILLLLNQMWGKKNINKGKQKYKH